MFVSMHCLSLVPREPFKTSGYIIFLNFLIQLNQELQKQRIGFQKILKFICITVSTDYDIDTKHSPETKKSSTGSSTLNRRINRVQ